METPITKAIASQCEQARPSIREIEENLDFYSKATGVMIFAASTCHPECGFVAHFMSRYMHKPSIFHCKLARRALGYLVRAATFGLVYNGNSDGISGGIQMERDDGDMSETIPQPIGASDSNHAVGPSVTAYVFIMGGAAVVWLCRLQKVSSISSSESEFYALSSCVAMSLHLRNLLEELGEVFNEPMTILCDSRGARMLAMHVQSTSRTRHIHRRWFFVTHYCKRKSVLIKQVESKKNWSNVLTKPVGMADFKFDRLRLGVVE